MKRLSKPLVEGIPFAKILIGLAILFAVSLGLCGLSIALVWNGKSVPPGMDHLINVASGYDVLAMVLSAAGLLVTATRWVVLTFVAHSVARGEMQLCTPVIWGKAWLYTCRPQ
jgi:hypothetical protein